MTPHEVRIKDLTPTGLRELADTKCTIWGQTIDPTVLIFLKPEPHEINDNSTVLEEKKEEETNG